MNNFIKQNWFKIGILVILGGTVFAFSQSNRNTTPVVSVTPSDNSVTAPLVSVVPSEFPTSTNDVQNPSVQTAPVVKIKSATSSTVSVTKAIPVPPAQPSWHTVFTYTGESSTDSAPFRMKGAHWRVTYSCTSMGQYPGVHVTITGADSASIGESESFGSSVDSCPPNHVYDFYNHTPGLYVVGTSDSNASYTITIEDYY